MLLEKLLDYRTVLASDDSIDNRMSCIVNLLVSFRKVMDSASSGVYLGDLVSGWWSGVRPMGTTVH
jgi:hypothetical protein